MLVKIGKIVDAHGLKGEIKVRFISEEPEWIEDLFKIYVSPQDLQGQSVSPEYLSFDIEDIRSTNQLWILKLTGVTDRTQAETFKNQLVFVTEDFFQTSQGEAPYLLELKGYAVHVGEKVCGQIIGFLETPAHSLILLKNSEGEYEVPWVESFIQTIDRERQIVQMDFPLDLLTEDFNTQKNKD